MRNRVERLRIWLLGSAVFLMLVIAAFIGYARFLSRLHHLKLPANLGVNVVREAGGWTLSRSKGSKTLYTIHAAKWDQGTNGKIALHDVSVMLYGRNGDRSDRIYGDEFEYDQNAGLVRATGLVHIDLQASGPVGGQVMGGTPKPAGTPPLVNQAAGPGAADAAHGARVLHVTTSSLVYMEKLGVAATSEYIEFQTGSMKGHATGADYSSDSGMLVLHSAVSMSGIAGGGPAELSASTASFDGRSQQAFLTHATYNSLGRTAAADQATLYTRSDGTLSRVEAQGNVTLQANGGTVVSKRVDVALNAASHPQRALLSGGVLYSSDQPLRQLRGRADEAAIVFDAQAKPQPEHAVFTGAVQMIERTRATEAVREPWSVRDLTAAKLETALVRTGSDNSQLRDADATGSPRLTVVNNGSVASTSGNGRTELSADDLKAHLIGTGDAKQAPQLDTIVGRGHTVLRQVSVAGVEQTSAGDTLDAKFRPAAGSGVARMRPASAVAGDARNGSARSSTTLHTGPQTMDTLLSAVQQGHVSMTRRAPGKSGAKVGNSSGTKAAGPANPGEEVEHAVAERAAYDGDRDRVTLTGSVQVSEAGSVLWANQVALDRTTGNLQAEGTVKVDYLQDVSSQASVSRAATARNGSQRGPVEPTHILADRADLEHATDIATFHGKPARLWQGGSQVQAPVIEFSREQKRLIARGETSTGLSAGAQPAQVHTVLVNAGSDTRGTAGSAGEKAAGPKCGPTNSGAGKAGAGEAGARARTANVVRIASGGLIYSDILRHANFTGGVRADTVDATIRASEATAYLQPAGAPEEAARSTSSGTVAVPSLSGDLERIVATGHVDIERPGLQATGERLVYTANDRVFLLTGDNNAPPKAVDAQGTTTGAALRFDSCENSVEALGAVAGAPPQRVRTDSRVSDDKKKQKGKP
jgi:lipopolysaccharide export system protein LptA